MRVLIHGLNYAPERGVGRYTGELGEWLARRDHEVRVVTAPPYYPGWRIGEGYSPREYRREDVAGAEVWRCLLWVPENPSGTKRLAHLLSFAASSAPAMLQQAPWRPEVVVMVEPTLFCLPPAWATARLSGAPLWVHVQDFELEAALGLGILKKNGVRRLFYAAERLLLSRADTLSAITEAMRRRAVEKGVPEERAVVFPNWSDTRFIRPLKPDGAIRREFGARPGEVLVMYAGNMGEKQGLDLVLEVAERLRDREEIKFALVGEGAARGRLEHSAGERELENVRFFPLQPSERLPEMLAAGDIHLVVQRRGAADLVMPSKLTNILAAGRPAVATAESGTELHRVLTEHDCGVVTTPESAGELASAIAELAADPEERRLLGRNARRYAEGHLDKEEILHHFEQELTKLAEG